jgi:glucan phosphorylase
MHAGGLDVLEGDKLYAAAALGLRYITLSLYYNQGYVS